MLTNILYKALLKISKENKDNNYIYSDILFPKTLLQKKIQKEKQNQLFSKKILSLYKLYDLNKSKTTKIKISKELIKNNKKQRNKEDKFNILSRLSYLNKPYFNSFFYQTSAGIHSIPRLPAALNSAHTGFFEIPVNISYPYGRCTTRLSRSRAASRSHDRGRKGYPRRTYPADQKQACACSPFVRCSFLR